MKALLYFLPLYRKHVLAMSAALALSLTTLVAGVALLGTSGWFITATALTTAGLAFNLFVPSSMVRGFSFIRIIARYGERMVGHNATLKLLSDLRGWLFGSLFPRLPLPDKSLRHGDLVSRLTADIDALDTAFLVAIGPWSAAVLIGGALTMVLAVFLPAAAPIYGFAMLAATLAVPAALIAIGRQLGRSSIAAGAEMRLSVFDGINGHADLTVLGALGTAQRTFEHKADIVSRLRTRLSALTSGAGFVVQALAAAALVGTLWAGLAALDAGTIEAALMVGLLLAVLGSFEATGIVVRSVGKATAAFAAAERLQAIASIAPPISDPPDPRTLPPDGPIEMADIHYSYDGRVPVLQGVNVTVAPGEHLAIMGPSGGGKSTLLRLLLRLADADEGKISLGGVLLNSVRQSDIHAHIALLSQDSPVFIDSIRNNLRIARPDADDAALWEALAKAQLADVVRLMPSGLDSLVGESGRTLSVGQARRLCLARVLVSGAPVILLDEPTNALDRPTEEAFFATLATALAGRTVIMATHASLPEGTVDRSLVLRHGKLTPL